ncbi:MAG TPA: hypothetical protein VIL36_06525 [Acidimicrobiales bacterium]|jgi:hypothetical protein
MADLAKLHPHTTAIVDALNADPDLFVFDGGYPTEPGGKGWGWQGTPGLSTFKPYGIVIPLTGGIFDGTLGCPDDDASLIWQVTCVGATRSQCEATVDRVNVILIGQQLTVPGRHISRVWADMAGGGARRDDTVQPPVFIATPRYRVESTPGGA